MTAERSWTFLTNHGHMLVAVARAPDARVQDLAEVVGVTPRAALSILGDLVDAGYVQRTRVGRRNHYAITPHRHFRHPSTAAHEVDQLLAMFTTEPVAAAEQVGPDRVRNPPECSGGDCGPAYTPPEARSDRAASQHGGGARHPRGTRPGSPGSRRCGSGSPEK